MAETDISDDAILALGKRPGRRAQAVQRLQIGGIGLGVILLVIGVANIVIERAQEVEDTAVPEAKLETPEPTEAPVSDPLAEIGVVPSPDPAPSTPATTQGGETLPSGETTDVPTQP